MPQHPQSVHDLIVRQHHTAVSCADWDKVKAFFVDLLGFKVVGEIEKRNEPELATVTGLRTAFVARPAEYGPHQKRDFKADRDWDVVADSFTALAKAMGC